VGGDTSEPKSYFELLEKRGGGAVGGYNRFWVNQGSAYNQVNGQIRTSIVIDPSDGQPAARPAKWLKAGSSDSSPAARAGQSAGESLSSASFGCGEK
jgi:hypothetical protein